MPTTGRNEFADDADQGWIRRSITTTFRRCTASTRRREHALRRRPCAFLAERPIPTGPRSRAARGRAVSAPRRRPCPLGLFEPRNAEDSRRLLLRLHRFLGPSPGPSPRGEGDAAPPSSVSPRSASRSSSPSCPLGVSAVQTTPSLEKIRHHGEQFERHHEHAGQNDRRRRARLFSRRTTLQSKPTQRWKTVCGLLLYSMAAFTE